MSCPYEDTPHVIGDEGCECKVYDDVDEDVDDLAVEDEEFFTLRWIKSGKDYKVVCDMDNFTFHVRQLAGKTYYVSNHPAISIQEDFDSTDDVMDAVEEAEEERISDIINYPAAVISVISDEGEEEDMLGYPGWGTLLGSGGLNDEYDAANQQSLSDIKKADDKWKSKGGTSSNKTTYVSCRHDPTKAVKIENIQYYGGSKWNVRDWTFPSNWLVVCLLDDHELSVVSGNEEALVAKLRPMTKAGRVINIDWPDMGAPPVTKGFFAAIHEYAEKHDITDVLFYCMGGHGRTGTALAATMIEVCGDKPADAVDYIRTNYCKQTVESSSQIRYLLSLYYDAETVEELMKGGKPEDVITGSKSSFTTVTSSTKKG